MTTLAFLPGHQELWLILLVVLLLFGGRKLPQLARSMGNSITQFKRGLKEEDSGEESEKIEGPAKDAATTGSETKNVG